MPAHVVGMMEDTLPPGRLCGRCHYYPLGPDGLPPERAQCPVQLASTRARDLACPAFEIAEGHDEDEAGD